MQRIRRDVGAGSRWQNPAWWSEDDRRRAVNAGAPDPGICKENKYFYKVYKVTNAVTPQSLEDGPVFNALRDPRLLQNDTYNRGYQTVDMVDYLDAMQCGGYATPSQVSAVANGVNYPWDDSPNCP